jgi:predicted ATPase/DNA-binding CsgD family transcriptional regulator
LASPKRDVLSTGRTHQPRIAPQHNLPALRSSFVGREQDMFEVERELSMTRLITLTGAGGSGKTRLAMEVARGLVDAYPDGVWLVELAPLSEEVLVPKAVAETLKVPERSQEPLSDTVADVLADRQLLLIVDNCEHLVGAAAGLVDRLLDSCPEVRILATSREALGVEGEVRWLVPPLSAPAPEDTPSSEELEAYGSVRLFVERAGGHEPSFSLSPHNALTVAEICRRLEGIPLAIELAAARIGTLSLQQILERLEDSLKLLTGGGRTTVPRQQTLKGTLDWSYDLLFEPERGLFRRLSTFAGGWTLEASEAVGRGEDVEEGEVLDLLSGLVEKSMVVTKGSDEGCVRYRLLEPVRQYALERLEDSGEAEAAKRAHAEYFLALTEEADPELLGPREAEWYDRLEEEHDNIRAALSWAFKDADSQLGLRLAGAIWWFWHRHGHLREGLRWLEGALAKEGGASAIARAKALGGIGWMAFGLGDLERMRESAAEGLRLSDEAGLGDYYKALFLRLLADASWLEGDHERATTLAEESLELSRQANDMGSIANSLNTLGTASLWGSGNLEQARAFYEESLAISREFGSASILRSCLNALALPFLLQGDLERAAALAEESAALSKEAGDTTLLPLPLTWLGRVALLRGDLEQAKALHKESLALSEERGAFRQLTLILLEGLACDAGAEGKAQRGARLFGATEALREAIGFSLEPALHRLEEPYLVGARSQLEESAWTEAWEAGRKMSMEAAVEYALSEEEPSAAHSNTTGQQSPSPAPEHTAGLTSREVEVLGLVAAGMTSAKIAKELFLSPRTVEAHLTSIYHKLGVTSRAGATRFALEHGLA